MIWPRGHMSHEALTSLVLRCVCTLPVAGRVAAAAADSADGRDETARSGGSRSLGTSSCRGASSESSGAGLDSPGDLSRRGGEPGDMDDGLNSSLPGAATASVPDRHSDT